MFRNGARTRCSRETLLVRWPSTTMATSLSDVLLCLGAWMSDINLGVHTGRLDGRHMILANSRRLKISHHVYEQVWIGDVVSGLADRT